jgi:hypothetical protein
VRRSFEGHFLAMRDHWRRLNRLLGLRMRRSRRLLRAHRGQGRQLSLRWMVCLVVLWSKQSSTFVRFPARSQSLPSDERMAYFQGKLNVIVAPSLLPNVTPSFRTTRDLKPSPTDTSSRTERRISIVIARIGVPKRRRTCMV